MNGAVRRRQRADREIQDLRASVAWGVHASTDTLRAERGRPTPVARRSWLARSASARGRYSGSRSAAKETVGVLVQTVYGSLRVVVTLAVIAGRRLLLVAFADVAKLLAGQLHHLLQRLFEIHLVYPFRGSP